MLPAMIACSSQLLEAVDFLHSHWIMSRDLKLPNLLLTNGGQLKICDFGLARYFHAFDEAYTPRVVTLWYRYCTWHSEYDVCERKYIWFLG